MKEQLDRIERKIDELLIGDDGNQRLGATKVAGLLGVSAGHVRKLARSWQLKDFPKPRKDARGNNFWLLGQIREYQRFRAQSDSR